MVTTAYFRKLFLSYLLLLLAPAAALTLVNYLLITPRVFEQELRYNARILEYVSRSSSRLIDEMWNLSYQYTFDQQFQQAAGEMGTDVVLLSRTIDRIENLKHSYDELHSVYVYLEDHEKIVATNDWYNDAATYYDTDWLAEYDCRSGNPALFARSFATDGESGRSVDVVTIVSRLKKGRGVIVFNLHQEAVGAAFTALRRPESSMFVFDGDGTVVSRFGSLPAVSEPEIREHLRELWNEDGESVLQLEGRSYAVTARPAGISDWRFVEVTSVEYLKLSSRMVIAFTALSTTACVVMGFILTFLLSRRMYSPIQMLVSNVADAGIPPGSTESGPGIDEFRFLTDRFTHIVDEGRQMKEALNSNSELAREQFLQMLVKGDVRDEATIESRLASLGINFEYGRFLIAGVEFDDWLKLTYLMNRRELRSHRDKLTELAREECTRAGCTVVPIQVEMKRVVLLFNVAHRYRPVKTVDMILSMVNRLIERAGEELGISISVGIGSHADSIEDVFKSYYQSYRALEYKAVYGNGQALFIDDIKRGKDSHFLDLYMTDFSEDKLISAVSRLDKTAITDQFDTVVERLIQVGADISYLRIVFMQYVALLSAVPFRLNLRQFLPDSGDEYRHMLRCSTVPEMKRYVRSLARSVVEARAEHSVEDPGERLVEEVLQYVDVHYGDFIGLETVADAMGISKYHLARVFKRRTGRTFNEYLFSVRMRHAKALLSEAALPIQDIARMVGYDDSNSFRRAFKQKCGVSPSAFRRLV